MGKHAAHPIIDAYKRFLGAIEIPLPDDYDAITGALLGLLIGLVLILKNGG